MKRKILIFGLLFTMLLSACAKKEVNPDVTSVPDISANVSDSDVNVTVSDNDNSDVGQNNNLSSKEVVIVEKDYIFGTWADLEKNAILKIESDDANGVEIVGDDMILVSNENSKFMICQVQGDQILTSGTYYTYAFNSSKNLLIKIDDIEYEFKKIDATKFEEVFESFKSAQPDLEEKLNIPKPEVVDDTTLVGAWVSEGQKYAFNFTDTKASCVTRGSFIENEYTIDGNTISIGVFKTYTFKLSDGVLTLTDAETGEVITCKKYSVNEYNNLKMEIYLN